MRWRISSPNLIFQRGKKQNKNIRGHETLKQLMTRPPVDPSPRDNPLRRGTCGKQTLLRRCQQGTGAAAHSVPPGRRPAAVGATPDAEARAPRVQRQNHSTFKSRERLGEAPKRALPEHRVAGVTPIINNLAFSDQTSAKF